MSDDERGGEGMVIAAAWWKKRTKAESRDSSPYICFPPSNRVRVRVQVPLLGGLQTPSEFLKQWLQRTGCTSSRHFHFLFPVPHFFPPFLLHIPPFESHVSALSIHTYIDSMGVAIELGNSHSIYHASRDANLAISGPRVTSPVE